MNRYFTLLISVVFLSAQTTGKISGDIVDSETNNPIIGANVIIVGTNLGAATDIDGSFYIINIPPGIFDLQISYIGYETTIIKDIKVSVNRTSHQNISINHLF